MSTAINKEKIKHIEKKIEKHVMQHGFSLIALDNCYIVKGYEPKTEKYQVLCAGNLSKIEAFIMGIEHHMSKMETEYSKLRYSTAKEIEEDTRHNR